MSASRHAALARDLIAAIGAGRFPVGSHLPTELELAESYGASRNTVRSALQELQGLGLISRKRRAGTRVEATTPRIGYRHAIASVETLMQFGAAHVRRVLSVEEVTAGRALARELGCPAGTRWLRLSSLRGATGGEPIGWTDSYLDIAHADLADEIEASPDVLISTLVEARYGRRVAEIRQDVDAAAVPLAIADALVCPPGAPALRILRRYLDPAGLAFLVTLSTHPAGRFTVSLRLRREVEGR
jgi:DNA-binding GntR family transcriptional regulator